MRETWNNRHLSFDGELKTDVLWKDSKTDHWLKLRDNLCKYIGHMSTLSYKSESEILKRILYKHENQMRRDKPFQYVKKVERLSARYVNMELLSSLKNLHQITNDLKKTSRNLTLSQYVSIPTYELMKYTLEKVIGGINLSAIIISKCQEAAQYLYAHMKYGFFVQFNTFAIAAVSKLWCLYKELSLILKELYEVIHEALVDFFTETFEYPLEMESLIDTNIRSMLPSDIVATMLHHGSKDEANSKMTNQNLADGGKTNDDIGEPISMEEIIALRKIQDRNTAEDVNIQTKEKSSDEVEQNDTKDTVTSNKAKKKSGDKTDQIDFVHTNKTNTLQFLHKLKKERNATTIIQRGRNLYMYDKLTTSKNIVKHLKICPVCENVIQKSPSLKRAINKPFKQTLVRQRNSMNLRHVIHELLHSTDVNRTRYLIFRYKHLCKLKKMKNS